LYLLGDHVAELNQSKLLISIATYNEHDNLRPLVESIKNFMPQAHILVVDDINDQGTTLNWIMKDWPSGCFPDNDRWEHVWGNNVRFAVVVDNLSSQCNIGMNYYGMEVNKAEEDVWIEFPYEEWWAK
jgi:hypoxanthine-guanine phosphoribosyltransferase